MIQVEKHGRARALAVSAIVFIGLVFLGVNLDLPVVRNSETYAQAAYGLIESGLDPRPVLADPLLSCGKPIGFSLLSVPLVQGLGANGGLMASSFLGTLAFALVASVLMARLGRIFAAGEESPVLETLVLWFNPLLLYQFWSAYPDTLFAALVLAVLLLAEDVACGRRAGLWTAIVVALLIVVATLLRYYGAVLVGFLPLAWVLCRQRRPGASPASGIVWLAVAIGVPVAFVVAGLLGVNPLLAPWGKGGGTEQYLSDAANLRLLLYRVRNSLVAVLFALVLVFNVLGILLFRRVDWRAVARDRRRLYWVLAASVFFLGLLPFFATSFNLRYFLPLLPFLAVLLAGRLGRQRKPVRRTLLAVFLVLQAALILNFNSRFFYERWAGLDRDLPRQLDNLRIGAHIDRRALLDEIERSVPPGAVLYLLSDYYDGCVTPARESLWRELGLDPARGIDIRPRPTSDVEGVEGGYWVHVDRLRLDGRLREVSASNLAALLSANVDPVGHGLYRIDPRTSKPGPGP
jgi:hypothetical protein